MDAIELLIIVASIGGQFLVSRQNKWGLALWIVSSFLLSWVYFHSGKYSLIGLQAVYVVMQSYGFVKWHRAEVTRATPDGANSATGASKHLDRTGQLTA